MPCQLEAIIFDVDGVITDTAEYQYLSWKRLTEEENIPFQREDNDQLRGVTRRESLRRILSGRPISEDTAQDWMRRKNQYYLQLLDDHLSPADLNPGLVQFIADARHEGIKLGVATASRNGRIVLERVGVVDSFDVIGDPDSIVNPKPAPDLFIWVAGHLHAHVARTLVVEDAEDSLLAARAAGFLTLGIGPAVAGLGHASANDLNETSLKAICQHLEQSVLQTKTGRPA